MTPHKYKFVAFAGIAGAGKNFWAERLKKTLESKGKKVAMVGFATALKEGLDPHLQKYLGISAFTENKQEKSIIRPFLIQEGMLKRGLSNGQFWADIVFSQNYLVDGQPSSIDRAVRILGKCHADYVLITDYRFNRFKNDEGHQVRANGGKIIYVERLDQNGEPVKPSIPEEIENDPYLRQNVDYLLRSKDERVMSVDEIESQSRYHINNILKDVLHER